MTGQRIPSQPLGKDACGHCDAPIHLTNTALGGVWVHADGFPWCQLRAVPASRPWPEVTA